MTIKQRTLTLLPEVFAICRLAPDLPIPQWLLQEASFTAITRTREELSVICPQEWVPTDVELQDRDWRCLKLEGPFELDEPGVMVSMAEPLATAGLSVFAEATYDTDYLLVNDIEVAITTLRQLGHEVVT
ncbi:MAG: ACT domain-containing protein [Thiolinea sp.]